MKHFKSRFFWLSVFLGYILWAVDYLFITKPSEFLPDFVIFSSGIIVSAFILDVFARKYLPNSKSWFNNKID